MRVLILRCGDAPLPDDLPGTVLDLPAVPGRRNLKLLDDAAAGLSDSSYLTLRPS